MKFLGYFLLGLVTLVLGVHFQARWEGFTGFCLWMAIGNLWELGRT